MLRLSFQNVGRMCDGINRRSFMQLGSMAVGGLTLADLLRAEDAAGRAGSTRAVINIHLSGGPPHQDMTDLKPDAPAEVRGEFKPIATNVPGIEVCELLPLLAKMADQFTIIRSLVDSEGDHADFQTHTGFDRKNLNTVGGRPAFGAVVSKVLGHLNTAAPPWVSYNGGPVGFLGPTHRGYEPGKAQNLRLERTLTADLVRERNDLRASFDGLRRDVDSSGQFAALDTYAQRATEMVLSGRMADALDLAKESPDVVARYGPENQHLLRARRLVQAGVRVISMEAGWGNWDTHPDNFKRMRTMLPKMDHGLSTFIADLQRLDMFPDVAVVLWGEFGRTPRINQNAGRDHWPAVSPALLTGGSFRHGQVIGATDRIAAYVGKRPVRFQEVFATLYHHLGINPTTTQLTDLNGRPVNLLEHGEPLSELV